MKHKHSEIIHAWADGAKVQCRNKNGEWLDSNEPIWSENAEYRIKPQNQQYIVATDDGNGLLFYYVGPFESYNEAVTYCKASSESGLIVIGLHTPKY